jgi:hypothetical protein
MGAFIYFAAAGTAPRRPAGLIRRGFDDNVDITVRFVGSRGNHLRPEKDREAFFLDTSGTVVIDFLG